MRHEYQLHHKAYSKGNVLLQIMTLEQLQSFVPSLHHLPA
jgi:hypothetical protein